MFAILLAIAAPDAHAWQVRVNDHGYELKWETTTIDYAINYAGNHGLTEVAIDSMIAGAARSWGTSIKNGMQFSHTGSTSIQGVSYDDGVNAIFFDEEWTEDPALLGLTYVWSTSHGEIVGFDMAINSDDHSWSTDGRADSNDLLNTMSHEFGHALGVDHSPSVEV
ncbi:MAG: matrixin family metalloprotease, partial [Myxococcota bacterium]